MRHFVSLLTLFVAVPALAEEFPTKPPMLYVGFFKGGPADQAGRITAAKLSEIWGRQIIVENHDGAGGTFAAEAAAKSPADGYTLIQCNIFSHGIAPSVYKKLGYDALNDFTYIGRIGTTAYVMVVQPSVPATTVAEFIAYAKANPGKVSYGSSGVGTLPHLSVELFKSMTSVQVVHVPYKGDAPSLVGLLAGEVQMLITSLPVQVRLIKSGRTRALGVSTAKRSPLFPDLPTIAEAGVPGYEVTVWYGLCGPARLPKSLVDKINVDLVKAVTSPDTAKRLADMGIDPTPSTPEQFTEFARAEIAKWAKVVKESGATLD